MGNFDLPITESIHDGGGSIEKSRNRYFSCTIVVRCFIAPYGRIEAHGERGTVIQAECSDPVSRRL
jgi:hypothetical protein